HHTQYTLYVLIGETHYRGRHQRQDDDDSQSSPVGAKRDTEGRTPRPPLRERLLQREDEYRGPGREILYCRPQRGVEAHHERAETARHRDVLLAVDGVADGTSTMAGARAEVPELLARVGVVRVHGALEVSVDHEAAARREHAPDRRILEVDAPLALA